MTPEEIQLSRLNSDRRKRLEYNETKMTQSAKEISNCLKDIHDRKLWEPDYPSFENYCKAKLGMSRQRAYQIIGATNAREMLMEAASGDPELQDTISNLNDRQAAELQSVPAEKRVEVLREATKSPKLTARTIKAAKARVVKTTTNKPETPPAAAQQSPAAIEEQASKDGLMLPCPHCGHIMPPGWSFEIPKTEPEEVIE